MSYHHTFNLKKLSHQEQQARYEIILKFTQLNQYFVYLPYISNPTNNYLKYPDNELNTMILTLTYGDIENDPSVAQTKKLYYDFLKDYNHAVEIYLRQMKEEQDRQLRLQEQQMAVFNYNSNTQPVAFNAGQQYGQQAYGQQYPQQYQQYPQQQQPYPQQQLYPQQEYQHGYNNNIRQQNYQGQGHRDNRGGERKQYNRGEQGQYYQPRDHQQHRDHQPRQHQGQYGQQNNYRRKQFHEKKGYQNHQPHPHQQGYNKEHEHLWHKIHTKTGDFITVQTQFQYDQLTRFIHQFNISVKIVLDPLHQYSSESNLMEEDQTAPQKEPEPEPEVPAIVVPPPKPQPKPKKFTISEIKQFINSISKEELERHVNPEVLAKATQISGWQTQEVEVEQKEDKLTRKESKKQTYNNNYKDNKNQAIMTGVRKDQAKAAQALGYKPKESSVIQITIGKNETLQTRKIKEDIKNMAGKDFATLKEKEYETMDIAQKSRTEIIYNLNLMVPENMKDIQKDIILFLFDDVNVCKVLIEEIIKKAWDQPKYASTYAKLCSNFSKRQPNEFKFEGAKRDKDDKRDDKKRDNPFKYFLIERVQHSFDQKIDKFPTFDSPEDKELFLKEKKKHILSNVKFIAQLILHKILKKRTIKYCISQLFESFLRHFYAFKKDNQIEDSVYDYHFEGIIEFIENIGSLYDEIGQKQKQNEEKVDYQNIKSHVASILAFKSPPNLPVLGMIENLSGEEYFKLLEFINIAFIRESFPRLSALLQNLVERKINKWQKHLSAADGPKKLKQIQQDILREENDLQGKGKDKVSKEKIELEKLDKKVKELFEGWEMDKKEQVREIRQILRKTTEKIFYFSFLKQVADEKKDKIIKRVSLFPVVLNERFKYDDFRNAWFDIIKYLAIGSGDYPFCGAALAQVLHILIEKEGHIQDFWHEYKVDDEEDEVFFLEEIFQKYYHYSQDENVLKFVKSKPKLSGLI